MIIVVVVAGIRDIAAELGNYGVAGIHIKAGFRATFEVNRGADIDWQRFQQSDHVDVRIW